MPVTITSPSGRAYRWDKVTPPTEEDFRALQAYDAAQQSDKSFLDTAIPTALRVGGAIGGAALGIPGGPPGIMAGGAAGSAFGEYLAQRHQGKGHWARFPSARRLGPSVRLRSVVPASARCRVGSALG